MTARLAHRRSRGLAILTVMWLLALMSVVLLSVSALFAAEVRRTREEGAQAQLRQLLTAGAIQARAALRGGGAIEAGPLPLPDTLGVGAELTLEPQPAAGDEMTVRVAARLDRRGAAQRLRFVRGAQGWELAEAALE